MQTIIYTNCKREAANYEVDKICFADRVDVSQLIQDEMNKYNIRHIHFWLISNNINNIEGCSDEKLLISMGKYLVENKDMEFVFQYLVQKYTQVNTQLQKKDSSNDASQSTKRNKSTLNLLSLQSNIALSATEPSKFIRNSQDTFSPNSKKGFNQQEIVKQQVKFSSFKQFQTFVKREIKNSTDRQVIKTYIFKTMSQSISLSFIQPDNKNLIKMIIDQDCDRIYDAKLNFRKKSTFQLSEGYENLIKRYSRQFTIPQTFYNKIILFLFNDDKNDDYTRNRKKIKQSTAKGNLSVDALTQWKIKQQNVDIITKLQKQCELIKQQIQNQKICFKNKVKAIQNYIGDTINVQRLIQQQDQLQSNSYLTSSNLNPSKQINMSKRSSIIPVPMAQALGNISKLSVTNNSFISSQFKRLKDISDALRNIDNTLSEQNKKIQNSKNKLKELVKTKQSLVFANARQLNKIKLDIVEAKSQIKRKQLQIQQNQLNGNFQKIIDYKNRQPTSVAKTQLQKYKFFLNNAAVFNNLGNHDFEVHQQINKNNKTTLKNSNQLRATHKSLHNSNSKITKPNLTSSNLFKEKLLRQADSSLDKQNQKRQDHLKQTAKLIKKSIKQKHQLSSQTLIKQENQIQNITQAQLQLKNQKVYQQLIILYDYYNKNQEIHAEMKRQIQGYRTIAQVPINTFTKQFNKTGSLYSNNRKIINCQKIDSNKLSKLNLQDFPILKKYLQSKNKQKQNNLIKSKYQKASFPKKHFKVQSKFPQDYFQLMLSDQTKKIPKTPVHQTGSSIKSELYDKIIQINETEKQLKKGKQPEKIGVVSRQKRITIQQAINLNASIFRRITNDK